jgi:uncharacterized protein (TIGR00251 family)
MMPLVIPVQDHSAGASFLVKVQPKARRQGITGAVGDALKVALTAPPAEGRANAACIQLLAEVLNVPRSSITIAAGQGSRNKLVRVAGVSAAQVRQRLSLVEHK